MNPVGIILTLSGLFDCFLCCVTSKCRWWAPRVPAHFLDSWLNPSGSGSADPQTPQEEAAEQEQTEDTPEEVWPKVDQTFSGRPAKKLLLSEVVEDFLLPGLCRLSAVPEIFWMFLLNAAKNCVNNCSTLVCESSQHSRWDLKLQMQCLHLLCLDFAAIKSRIQSSSAEVYTLNSPMFVQLFSVGLFFYGFFFITSVKLLNHLGSIKFGGFHWFLWKNLRKPSFKSEALW